MGLLDRYQLPVVAYGAAAYLDKIVMMELARSGNFEAAILVGTLAPLAAAGIMKYGNLI